MRHRGARLDHRWIVLFNLLHAFLTGVLGLVVSALYALLLLIAGVTIALRR